MMNREQLIKYLGITENTIEEQKTQKSKIKEEG